jgi:hypothetical protein
MTRPYAMGGEHVLLQINVVLVGLDMEVLNVNLQYVMDIYPTRHPLYVPGEEVVFYPMFALLVLEDSVDPIVNSLDVMGFHPIPLPYVIPMEHVLDRMFVSVLVPMVDLHVNIQCVKGNHPMTPLFATRGELV